MENGESIRKVIFLDEQAVVDFLELAHDGQESVVMKKLSESMAGISAEAEGGKSFFGLAKLKLSGSASHQRNNIIETQISSTLISSFINIVKIDTDKKETDQLNMDKIIFLNNIKLVIVKDSPAYYRNLSPVLNMIEDLNKLNTMTEKDKSNFSGINIKEMERTLDSLSGYYDLLGYLPDGTKKIIRFNISGLRNNYTLNDLTKINLKLYGVKVGESSDSNIEFNHQMNKMTDTIFVSGLGADFDDEIDKVETFDIIDIIFAGV